MARIRTIKPEFFDSPGTARASYAARLLFIAMWCWADDWGVGAANPKALIGFAFPNDDDITAKDFPTLRKEVADAFGVTFYEVEGRPYYCIPSWDKHQRTERKARRQNPPPPEAQTPENPGNDGTSDDGDGTSLRVAGSSGEGTGEQGNRGTGEQVADAPPPRPEVEELCQTLADLIEGNGSLRPNITKAWRDSARLMLDRDKRDPKEAGRLIRWSQANDFWRPNIRSMPKFREKYDTLRLQAGRDAEPAQTGFSGMSVEELVAKRGF